MLTTEDLKEIGQYINLKLEKTVSKIQNERNAKIVNYKIRAFIEKIRDKLKRFEPVSIVDHSQTIVNKASQLDRIEMTIGQVLNTVQRIAKVEETPLESPSQISLSNQQRSNHNIDQNEITYPNSDHEKVPSRQRSNERNATTTAQKMQ